MEEKKNISDFNEQELQTLQQWQQSKTFDQSLEQTKQGEPFVFYDGPPFATGLPHYGSLLPSIIKDAIPRYQTMKGKFVRRRWGWDCHGLPIENIVEQKLGISGKKQIEQMGVEQFNATCRENILQYAHDWKATIDRIARWVEFDGAYMTMSGSYMESVWWALKQIWDKGLIYEDRKVLLYCSRCETPISNFEVAMDNSYRDVTEESVVAKFRLQPRQRIIDVLTGERTYVLAWTTTPWTLPGNTALNVGGDIAYVLVKQGEEEYILAKDRLEVLEGSYEIVKEFSARSIEGLIYEPLFPGVISNTDGRAHRIYIEDFVTTTDGTGVVHNAAMYGEEDYEAARRRNLPREHVLDHKGQYKEHLPEHLRGLFFKEADPVVIAELRQRGLLYKAQSYTHSYPFCHRCATPLFYNALSAWFVNIQRIKQRLLELNQTVNWYPEHLKLGRFGKGIESAPDWNISRNRYWATPLPFWRCGAEGCGVVTCVGSVGDLQSKSINFNEVYPAVASYGDNIPMDDISVIDLHRPYIDKVVIRCTACGGNALRIPEVVDCWVESGSMPFAELHYPFENQDLFKERFPSDFVVEYIPQTRAWFYVMHVIATILFDRSPFRNVLTTGTILAEDGSKMSKSKNNYPDPNIVLEKYGADAMRFYLLTSPVVNGEDINFSEKLIDEANKKLNLMLQNLLSFYRLYTNAFAPEVQPTTTHILDRWILALLTKLINDVTKYMDAFNTAKAGKALLDFTNDFSTWYLRRSRDRIKAGDVEAESALGVFGYVLAEFSKLLAPFMPFASERIYQALTGRTSVHLAAWPAAHAALDDEKLLEQMDRARQLVEIGLALRKENNLKVRQPLLTFEYVSKGSVVLSADIERIIAEELNVRTVSSVEGLTAGMAHKEGGVETAGLNTVITPELAKEGLAREIERQIQDLRKKSGLSVGELVDVYYNTQNQEVEDALIDSVDRKKTFVSQISKSYEVEVDYEVQAEVNGKPLWIGINKV